jgi:hypothetical protein
MMVNKDKQDLSLKEWEKVLLKLWRHFGIYAFKVNSIYLNKREKRWIYHLRNWGLITRRGKGVYYINKSGMRQIFRLEGKL